MEGVTSSNSLKRKGLPVLDSLEGNGLPVQTLWKEEGYQCKLFGRERVTSANSLEGKGLPVQTLWKGKGESNLQMSLPLPILLNEQSIWW